MSDSSSHTTGGAVDPRPEPVVQAPPSQIRTRERVAFGKYELLVRLRVGGMAEVWKARESAALERTVALKRVLPSFSDEADYIAMFIDEARLGMQLSHPNIVRALELGQVEDEHYIALELIEGQDLASLMRLARERHEPLSPALACHIAIEVCAALHYAHELCDERGVPLGIVHRDVSPQNVLVSYDGDVKLIDFGIAKSSEQLMRTQAGLLKGKHGYLSPEQAQGQPVDRRSDLFSLGVCLYELLTAQRLFQGSSDFSTIVKVRNAEIPALETLNRDVPVELATIVHRALARERGARFQTALELQRALTAFVEQTGARCDRDELGNYLRDRFPAADGAAAEGVSVASDESTGLLAAFDAVEPTSALSTLTELPASRDGFAPVAERELTDLPEPPARDGWSGDESFESLNDEDSDVEPLRERPPNASLQPVALVARAAAVAPVASEPDDREPITDRPVSPGELLTRVVSYESTHDGQVAPIGLDPTRVDRRTPQVGAVSRATEAEGNGSRSAVVGIGLEWADEELSTQIYDPPAGEDDVVGASPARRSEDTRRTRPTPTPTPMPRGASMAFVHGVGQSSVATAPIYTASAPTQRGAMSSAPPVRASASVLSDTRSHSVQPPRVSSPPFSDARPSIPTPRGSLSPFGLSARSSVPPARVSLPPPGALPSAASILHPELRVSMPPMGSNRGSTAPMRLAPPADRGPSRAALGWAAGVAAMIVAALVVGLSWFGRPAPAILHVTTEPMDSVVTVDGVAVSGTSSPFVATDLAPEVDHDIEVSHAGYHSWRTRLRLRPGRVLALPMIALQREVGRDERSSQQPSAAPVAAPRPPAAEPPAAFQPRPASPALPNPAPGASSRPRRAQPRARSAPPRTAAPVAGPKTASPPVPGPALAPDQEAPHGYVAYGAQAQPARSAEQSDKGTLRVNSRPWSRVYIDGRLVGNTPQMQLSLGQGWHTVTLVNPDFGLQKVLTIRIQPGEVVTKIIELAPK